MIYFAKLGKQKDGSYLVEFPELPGCLTEGKNKSEALANAKEALDGWLAANCDRDLNIHAPVSRKGSHYHAIEVDLNIAFAVKLRLLRAHLGLTQSAAAKKLRISQQAYAKLESPRTSNPSLSTIKKIADSLQVSVLKLVS
jgi:predicted RNase H-like HicB family nuclease/DNA-binding XRE family transcriptional regulator